jgi:hypothetical protein
MDLPIADLSETGLDVRGYEARVLKTSKSRPILRYAATCFDKEKNTLIRINRILRTSHVWCSAISTSCENLIPFSVDS